jgi:hypothetical protein
MTSFTVEVIVAKATVTSKTTRVSPANRPDVGSAPAAHMGSAKSADATSAHATHVASAKAPSNVASATTTVTSATTTVAATATATAGFCAGRSETAGKQGSCQNHHQSSSHHILL